MNTYQIEFDGMIGKEIAETPGKAKYNYWNTLTECCEIEFSKFIKIVKCKLLNKFSYKDLFTTDLESFERMKYYRGIEFAFLGMKVEMNGKPGRIVGSNRSLNLDICFDGQNFKENCHPWWKMKYFDNNGNLIKEFDK